MQKSFSGPDKRRFLRISYVTPVKYKIYPAKILSKTMGGISKNISQTGLLFKADKPVALSTVVWVNLDYKTLEICRELEENLYPEKDGFLARVVRIEENPTDNTYNIGICFLLKEEKP